MNEQKSLFDGVDVIHSYSRAQAIDDGVLIDASEIAREAGVRFPVAVTAGLWLKYIVPDEASALHCQSTESRLWDTLWLLRHAAKNFAGDTLFFEVSFVMKGRKMTRVKLKAVCGPGDTPEPVITIMLPGED
jgi:hypothetical protein